MLQVTTKRMAASGAMPVVKPMITGSGMYLMMSSILATPVATSMKLAIKEATCRPIMSCFAVITERMTMKASVGPVIWKRLPLNKAVSRIYPRKKKLFDEVCARQDLNASQVVRKPMRQYLFEQLLADEVPDWLAPRVGKGD